MKKFIFSMGVLVVCTFTFISLKAELKQPIISSAEAQEVYIADAKNNCDAIYTLISDDGYYESGVILNELSKEFDLHTTVAGIVKVLEPHLAEWKQIVDEGYVELISHSSSHFAMKEDVNEPDEKYEEEIIGSKKWLEENIGRPVISFVCPENECNEKGYEFIKKAGYYSVRRGTPGENEISPEDGTEPRQWLNLGKRGIGDVQTTAERNAWVDEAINNHSWLIEMWHDISPNGDLHFQPISTQMAKEHLSYIASMRDRGVLWVASMSETTRYIKEKQHTTVEMTLFDREGIIRMDCDRDVLPLELFQDELTVVFKRPKEWKSVEAVQNGVELEVKECENGYLMINAVPNGFDIDLISY